MPYSVKRHPGCPKNRPWAVVKDSDGSTIGCHPSRTSARRQQRALYANEGKSHTGVVVERVPEPTKEELLPMPPEMFSVIEQVASAYYPDLDFSAMKFFMRETAPIEAGAPIMGQVDVKNKHYPEADFVVWLANDTWQTLTDAQKQALVDHELHHCGYNDHGTPYLTPHDIEEYNDVIARHGIWWNNNKATVDALRSLDFGQGEITMEGEDTIQHQWICNHLAARPRTKARRGSTGAGGSSGSTGAGTHGSSGAGGSSGSTGVGGSSGSTGVGGSSGSTGVGGSSGSTGAGNHGSTGAGTHGSSGAGTHGSSGANANQEALVNQDYFSIPISEGEWIALCPECFVMAARSIFEDLLEGI